MQKFKRWLQKMDKTKRIALLFVSVSFLLIISLSVISAIERNVQVQKQNQKQEQKENKTKEDKKAEEATVPSIEDTDSVNEFDGNASANEDQVSDIQSNLETNSSTQESSEYIQVNVSVVGIDNVQIASGVIQIEKGKNAFEGLQQFADLNNLTIKTTGFGPYVYVSGINDLVEYGHGSSSGWMYMVNENRELPGAGKYILNENDQMVWYYVYN